MLRESAGGGYVECWFRCESLDSFLRLLEELCSSGYVLSIGSLRGDVFTSLPSDSRLLLDALTYNIVIPSNTRVVLEMPGLDRVFDDLLKYFYRLSMRPRSRVIRAKTSRPLDLTRVFDMGVRVLKPFLSPPKLLKPRVRGGVRDYGVSREG